VILGTNQTITLPNTLTLTGSVTDEEFDSLTMQWTMVSGPGSVTFSDASSLVTEASFSEAGIYVLRLTVSDGRFTSIDHITVIVNSDSVITRALEAEAADIMDVFTVETDPLASGGNYLTVPTGVSSSSIPSEDAFLDAQIDSGGQFTIWARIYSPSSSPGSVFLGFNNTFNKVIPSQTDSYQWMQVTKQTLSAADHKISIGYEDPQVRIDLIVVSNQNLAEEDLDALIDESPAGPPSPPPPTSGGTVYPSHPFYDAVRAFPGAEGFGANATGGRGGQIVFITNLKNSGPGSARAAFEADFPRYIIPLVWGYVDLKSGINVTNGNFTYAGQFMPNGKGLAFRNVRTQDWGTDTQSTLHLSRVDNAILRYLKIYRGVNSNYPDIGDGLTIYKSSNVIVDHSAVAFGNDENINVQSSGSEYVTIQHTWSVESLHFSTHPKTLSDGTQHGAGMLIGGDARNVTVHHDFFYLNGMRNPRVTAIGLQDIVNNYDYNNHNTFSISQQNTPSSQQNQAMQANVVRNLREEGPYTRKSYLGYGMRIWQGDPASAIPSVYLEGNIHPFRQNDIDKSLSGEWAGVNEGTDSPPIRLKKHLDTPAILTTSALQAKDDILNWGGPSYVIWNGVLRDVRDELLARVASDARNGVGPSRARGKDDFQRPSLPTGSILENEFWNDYFNSWRDTNYPGKNWDDYVDGYQVIEHFLNSWVPDFPSMSF